MKTIAIPMPRVQILLVHTIAHVMKDLQAMEVIVQVQEKYFHHFYQIVSLDTPGGKRNIYNIFAHDNLFDL